MGAGEAVRQVVPLAIEGDARLLARISADDDALEIDNQAAAWLAESEPLDVVIVSPDAGALGALFARAPGVRATFATEATYKPGSFLYLPGKMSHFGGVKGATVVQLHGQAPFKIELTKAGGTR